MLCSCKIICIVIAFCIYGCAFATKFPDYTFATKLPRPTGLYTVGYKNFEFTYKSKVDTSGKKRESLDQKHDRKLKVTVYYPSKDPLRLESYGAEEIIYLQGTLNREFATSKITQEEFKQFSDEISHAQVYKEHEASLAPGKFPVILFEHGFDTTVGSYQNIILDLVSNGYVVIGVTHPSVANNVVFKDGSVIFNPNSDNDITSSITSVEGETSVRDTLFVLSQLQNVAAAVPSADITKIGIIGHSLGGAAAIYITRLIGSVIAGISLDGAISRKMYIYEDSKPIAKYLSITHMDDGSNIDKPFLHIIAERSSFDCSALRLAHDNFMAVIKETEHSSFLDYGVLPQRSEIIQLIRSFYDRFLKDKQIDIDVLLKVYGNLEARETFDLDAAVVAHMGLSSAAGSSSLLSSSPSITNATSSVSSLSTSSSSSSSGNTGGNSELTFKAPFMDNR